MLTENRLVKKLEVDTWFRVDELTEYSPILVCEAFRCELTDFGDVNEILDSLDFERDRILGIPVVTETVETLGNAENVGFERSSAFRNRGISRTVGIRIL